MHKCINCPKCSTVTLYQHDCDLKVQEMVDSLVYMELVKSEIKDIGLPGQKFREGHYHCPVCGYEEVIVELAN